MYFNILSYYNISILEKVFWNSFQIIIKIMKIILMKLINYKKKKIFQKKKIIMMM